ncbi:hypothetical protein C8R47DRAFT_512405 [Mycena vitilis]|nr:hypothetical protein C8R47DRAFT_512405 [Mycena vitilis]
MSTSPTTTTLRPPEIWRDVFRFAVGSIASHNGDYLPFQPGPELQEMAASLDREHFRLKTCLSLLRVSRLFREIAEEFMYEDVRIFDARGWKSFVTGLNRTSRERGGRAYGSYVKRLELPSRRTQWRTTFPPGSHNPPLPIYPISCDSEVSCLDDILRLCPHLEVLVRPCLRLDAENITFWSSLIRNSVLRRLPRLMRLEWHESELDPRFYGTAHSDRLREIVSLAPNLRYLFLSSDRRNSLADLALPPSLHTIRINRSNFSQSTEEFTSNPRHTSSVPNFRNLVIHTTLPSALLDFVAAAGQQLRVLELAFAPQMTFSSNQMQRLLSRCPRLEELAYYLGAPEISPLLAFQSSTVKRVRLKINPDEWNPCRPVLRSQMEVLAGNCSPRFDTVFIPPRFGQGSLAPSASAGMCCHI